MANGGMIRAPASLRYKLTVASLIATVAALLTSGGLFLLFLYTWGLDDMTSSLQIKADVVSANSRAALAFGDAAYASETLEAFSLEPSISEAALILPGGEILALYRPAGSQPDTELVLADLSFGMTIAGGHMLLYQSVVLDSEAVGALYVHQDLDALYSRLITYLLVMVLAVFAALLVAWILYRRLQGKIERPFLDLVETVTEVSQGRNYAIRVQSRTDDELGTLIDGFNEMLRQIESRDQRLRNHQEFLERQVETRTKELLDANEQLVGEVDMRRRTEAEMRKLSSAVVQAADAVMITDTNGVIEYVNPAFERMTLYSAEEAVGKTPRILKSGKHKDEFFAQLWRSMAAGKSFHDVIVNRRKDGTEYHEEVTIAPVRGGDGEVTHFISTGRDITDRMKTQEQLRHLAHHDAVTGLPNRVLLMDRIEQSLHRARRHELSFAVLFIDLDGFKTINDSLGHHAGDELLRGVAKRLSAAVRSEDTVARLGGDEFAVVLDSLRSTSSVEAVAGKLLQEMSQPMNVEGKSLKVTGSIGIAVYPDDGEAVHELLRRADSAMYLAKRSGKNNFRTYSSGGDAQVAGRLELEQFLRTAADEEAFLLFYQPQVRVETGAVVGVEALLRLKHPTLGLLDPSRFLPILEETGLIMPVGNWALSEACRQVRRWCDQGLPPLRMAVNLSGLQFEQPDLVTHVRRAITDAEIEPGILHLEITERVLVDTHGSAMQTLEELSSLGVGLAVDDFGVGYSSLNYLKRMPIQKLKIDKSFIRDVITDADDRAITETIIALARGLRLSVVAEGVETEEQLAFLENLDCDEVQGHLFSPALAPMAFMAWYADNCPLQHGHLQDPDSSKFKT
jgi:diguanylate cyclase (GGDEF)-like protein/PAS domain S-box-containing protein